ncbi:MAG: ATP-dependent DNA helicase RecG, partial [Methylococcales bacterium]|nr:ATP-dependent DNA helicase RecG [Methylococcales bacterium]
MSDKLHLNITTLKGIGAKLAEKFQRLNITTLQDLVFHLPARYLDRTRITPISSLQHGQYAVICAEVVDCKIAFGRKRSMNVSIIDEGSKMTLKFFFFSKGQQAKFTPGSQILCFGEVTLNKFGLSIIHPEYQIIQTGHAIEVEESLTPIYPCTEGLNQGPLRKHIKQALSQLQHNDFPELLPLSFLPAHMQTYHTLDALLFLHAPPAETALSQLELGQHPAQQRLAVEELASHHLSFLRLRKQQQSTPSPQLNGNQALCQLLNKQLPFKLTNAQHRVIREIEDDMQLNKPMLRLVQGDVGSGKTIVAAYAALRAIESGYQVAIMAPTELLTEQHYRHFSQWFQALQIPVAWLTGKHPAKHKKTVLAALKAHDISLIIGTHALFQEAVEYDQLGLVIVDEQHRFGVNQRLALKAKAGELQPHQLTMTATPIPRTLAMTAYANLDVSVIDELPPGRKPVVTAIIPNARRNEIIEKVHTACKQGRQVYWVC